MPPIIKVMLVILVALALYSAFMVAMPHIRFAKVKGTMKDSAANAVSDTDESLAKDLAEVCLEQKVPLVGDFFYKVQDEQGKTFYYQPETDQEKKLYLTEAAKYFRENIKRVQGRDISISIDYEVEVYFPFGIYTLKKKFSHTEVQQLAR